VSDKNGVSKVLSIVLPSGLLGASMALASAWATGAVTPTASTLGSPNPPREGVAAQLHAIRAAVSEMQPVAVSPGSALPLDLVREPGSVLSDGVVPQAGSALPEGDSDAHLYPAWWGNGGWGRWHFGWHNGGFGWGNGGWPNWHNWNNWHNAPSWGNAAPNWNNWGNGWHNYWHNT
jgi:hypothetical protein